MPPKINTEDAINANLLALRDEVKDLSVTIGEEKKARTITRRWIVVLGAMGLVVAVVVGWGISLQVRFTNEQATRRNGGCQGYNDGVDRAIRAAKASAEGVIKQFQIPVESDTAKGLIASQVEAAVAASPYRNCSDPGIVDYGQRKRKPQEGCVPDKTNLGYCLPGTGATSSP